MQFTISTKGENDIQNINGAIQKLVDERGVKDGIVFIFSPHTTVGITLTEDEKGVRKDMQTMFQNLVPQGTRYHHDGAWAGDENGYAHIRSALIKPFVIVPVKKGKLVLGTWQSVLFIDFDGTPRQRTIYVEVIGGG